MYNVGVQVSHLWDSLPTFLMCEHSFSIVISLHFYCHYSFLYSAHVAVELPFLSLSQLYIVVRFPEEELREESETMDSLLWSKQGFSTYVQ